MKKRVLLIANNTGEIGAYKDVERYRKFFLSPAGGAWEPGEILPALISPSFCELTVKLCELNNECLDYLIVVFSGHGALDANGKDTNLCLNGEELTFHNSILDRYLFGHAAKQLTILDCCRCNEEAEQLTECIKCAGIQVNEEQISRIRQSYESQIARTPQGNCIVYACARNQTAMGDDSVGGDFSSLMNNPDFLSLDIDFIHHEGMSVYCAFRHVCDVLRTKGVFPEIVKNPEDIGKLPWMMYPEHF